MIDRLRRIPAPLALILVVAVVEACAWALVMPALQGPDEVGHFTYVQRVVERGEIPFERSTVANPPGASPYSTEVVTARVQGGLGPLAANVAARPYWDQVDERLWSERDAALPASARDDGGYTSSFKNPPLYYLYAAIPYVVAHGGSFFDREILMRAANIPLLLVALVFVWLLVGELVGRGRPQIIATASAALLPQLLNVTATINPDILLVAEWSAALYLMVLIVQRGPRRGLVAWLAVLCVLGALTHARSLPLFLPAALAVLLALARECGWRRVTAWRAALALSGLYAVAVLALSEVGAKGHVREFVSYVWQFYLPKLGFMTPKVGPPGYGFREGVIDRLYGTLAQLEVVLPHSVETAMYWLSLAALVALVAALIARRDALRARREVAIVLGVAIFALVLGVHAGAYRGIIDQPSDPVFTARYLLPLLPLFGAAIALIAEALPRRAAAVFCGLVLACGFALQLESIGLLLERFYA